MTPEKFLKEQIIISLKRMAIPDNPIQHEKFNPYFSFLLFSAGIEFLGKCLNNRFSDEIINGKKVSVWHLEGKGINDFDLGLSCFKHKELYIKYSLRDNLRNGFAHSLLPKNDVILTHTSSEHVPKFKHHEIINIDGNEKLVLDCTFFYYEFIEASELALRKCDMNSSKMKNSFLVV